MTGCLLHKFCKVSFRLFFIFVFFIPFVSWCQCKCLSGSVQDQGEKLPLAHAVIAVLSEKDSVLQGFARSDAKGSFRVPLRFTGKFVLMISYPGYADYVDAFTAARDTSIDVGRISLIKKAELLQEVIVKQQLGAIRVKGDTIEYSADSFHVAAGASVAELLKKLPGIQVDRNGTITAQGQTVNKVLVDGEEFFSDDPAVVTQNLGADYVKDVQVFDKKSEQSEFSGVDDGKKTRTINLKLKADKKKGYFGKINIAGGTNHTFDNSALINSFKGARKLSAFGIMSNTDHTTLDWDERQKLGGDEGPEYDETQGNFTYTGSIDDDFQSEIYSDEGLPTTWTAGLHYSDKWEDKNKVNTDFRFMKRNLASESGTISRYILPDTQYFNSETRRAFTTRMKSAFTGKWDLTIDSTSVLRVSVRGSRMTSTTASANASRALNGDSDLVNDNSRTLNSDMAQDNLAASIMYRKKMRKKGRTLSVNFDERYSDESLTGFLRSTTDFYRRDSLSSTEKIDQKKLNSSNSNMFNAGIVYTEPLTKKLSLSLQYRLGVNLNTTHRNTLNKDAGDEDYKLRDTLYSNDFRYNYTSNAAGAQLQYKFKKVNVTVGGLQTRTSYSQRDLGKDSTRDYSFLNLFPYATVSFAFNSQRNLYLGYHGSNTAPTPEQIQPVRQNTDPLNIQIGNPALRQSFSHRFYVSYFDYKVLTQRGMYISTNATIDDRAISMSSTVDSGGKTTTQYVNTPSNFSGHVYFNYNLKLKGPDLYAGINGEYGVNTNNTVVNGLANVNNNQNFSIGPRLSKYKDKKYDISINPRIGYVYTRSSIRRDVVTEYVTATTEISGFLQMPAKFSLNSSATYSYRQKTDVFSANRNVLYWEASVSKKFGKNDKAEVSVKVNDILNQNIGFDRSATSTFITEHTYSTLRRYAMIRFVYNLSKTP